MASDITIRAASPADAAAIAIVHVEAWLVGYRGLLADELLARVSVAERESMWEKRLTDKDTSRDRLHIGVAVDRGAVVGFVSAGPGREWNAPTERGEIYAMYVHPERWSRGVGQALMRSAIDFLISTGVAEALLWVLSSNSRARRFYELCGWTWDGQTRTRRLSGEPDFDSESPDFHYVEEACYRRPLTVGIRH